MLVARWSEMFLRPSLSGFTNEKIYCIQYKDYIDQETGKIFYLYNHVPEHEVMVVGKAVCEELLYDPFCDD